MSESKEDIIRQVEIYVREKYASQERDYERTKKWVNMSKDIFDIAIAALKGTNPDLAEILMQKAKNNWADASK